MIEERGDYFKQREETISNGMKLINAKKKNGEITKEIWKELRDKHTDEERAFKNEKCAAFREEEIKQLECQQHVRVGDEFAVMACQFRPH